MWWTLTGDFAWCEQSREPTLTTNGKFCHQGTLSRPPTWSQRQPSSRAQEELEEKSILLRNVWRFTQLTLSRPIQIMTLFRGGCTSSREISWHMGRRITARVARNWSVVVVHKVTLRNVGFALKESSGKRRKGKLVFVLQPVELVMLPRGVR